jgi:hypothetical protein
MNIEEGATFKRRNQRSRITDTTIPYTCRSGREIYLVELVSHCAECRRIFSCTATRSKVRGLQGGYLTRRCLKHARKGVPVKPRSRRNKTRMITTRPAPRAPPDNGDRGGSGDLIAPSPPPEKTAARQK